MNKRVSKMLKLQAKMMSYGKTESEKEKIYKRLKKVHKEIKGQI